MSALPLLGTVRAELLKARKRPAVWVLTATLIVLVVLFGYLLNYAMWASGQQAPGLDPDQLLAGLLPASLTVTLLNQLGGFGIPIALILAVLVVGSEYGWGTIKTLAVQRPTRAVLLTGKLLLLAVWTGLLVVAAAVAAWAASLGIAGLEGASVTGPPVGELLGGLGSAWLILLTYSALGVVLAVVLRSTGLALGLGLIYVLVVENLLLTVPFGERFSEVVASAALGPNAFALAQAFGEPAAGMQMIALEAPSVRRAVLAVLAYLLVFSAGSVAAFRRRDVA